MTREEEIEKILDDEFDTDLYDYITDNSYCNYCAGFRQGVEWADAHPINVWHNTSEKPELNQYFLAQIDDTAFDTFIMCMDENKDWRKWSEGMNIKMWAHINDLLPKGSGK